MTFKQFVTFLDGRKTYIGLLMIFAAERLGVHFPVETYPEVQVYLDLLYDLGLLTGGGGLAHKLAKIREMSALLQNRSLTGRETDERGDTPPKD